MSTHSWVKAHGLAQALEAAGLYSQPDSVARLHTYATLVQHWNRTYNLTGARDESRFVHDHLLDTLVAIPIITHRIASAQTLMIDLGTGAGLPGIPLAIADPLMQVALVEPVGKKAAFLRQAIATCRLANVVVHAHRMDQALPALAANLAATGRQPHFTSRAFATLDRLITETAPLATPGSRLFALKSRGLDEELAALAPGHLIATHRVDDPRPDVVRYVVELSPLPIAAAYHASDH